jgi:hypothetical protein
LWNATVNPASILACLAKTKLELPEEVAQCQKDAKVVPPETALSFAVQLNGGNCTVGGCEACSLGEGASLNIHGSEACCSDYAALCHGHKMPPMVSCKSSLKSHPVCVKASFSLGSVQQNGDDPHGSIWNNPPVSFTALDVVPDPISPVLALLGSKSSGPANGTKASEIIV